jgi:hypothetical protein
MMTSFKQATLYVEHDVYATNPATGLMRIKAYLYADIEHEDGRSFEELKDECCLLCESEDRNEVLKSKELVKRALMFAGVRVEERDVTND